MATSSQVERAARGASYQPWGLAQQDAERAKHLVPLTYADERGQAAEREERWHAALLLRRRYRNPASWLDCVGLDDVPTDPAGWCTCPPTTPGDDHA